MKIAIPTNDGFTVNQGFNQEQGFLVTTIRLGEVVQQEMRWNQQSEILASAGGTYKNLSDCDKIIVREINIEMREYLQLHSKEVIKTEETIITTVLMQYLQEVLQKESNTCCCP